MPQLDKVHFFSQYFWLCVFYFGFYFLIIKHFLPRMARILQFRKNKLSSHSHDNQHRELNLVQESGNTVLDNVFSTSHKFWSHHKKRSKEWYEDKVWAINNNYLKASNNLYVKKMGDYSLSQNSAIGGIRLASPEYVHIHLLGQNLLQLKALKNPALPDITKLCKITFSNSSFSTNREAKPTLKKESKNIITNNTPINNKKTKKPKSK